MVDERPNRVVVIDDDQATIRLLKRQLEAAGYEVATFADARSSMESIIELGTGIVISDWEMPDMNGLELCEAVRGLEQMQAVQQIYFILLTAQSGKDHVIQGLDGGANDILAKPYHQGELLARIKVGERMLRLQDELLQRNVEVQKANAQMALLARRLDEQAKTDALTGLSNRRFLFQRLANIWKQTRQSESPLSCIMLDIDHFKKVNDTYGHAAGDHVLRKVSTLIRQAARRPDLCGRFGGEEFAVLCPGMNASAAAQVAEQIRVAVSAEPIDCDGMQVPVTISSGTAEICDRITEAEELIKAADTMLYAAKTNGRNCVWVLSAGSEGVQFDPHNAPELSSSVAGA